jgi:DNA-binding MarR family transcriptional regulator
MRYIWCMPTARLSDADYAALATFRYELRRFLRFSEQAARAVGLEPQQHQLLLALRGTPGGAAMTVGALAERLQVRHHAAVGLVDRMAARGLVRRMRAADDGRRVLVALTARGVAHLPRLSHAHREELRAAAPRLLAALRTIVRGASARARRAQAA